MSLETLVAAANFVEANNARLAQDIIWPPWSEEKSFLCVGSNRDEQRVFSADCKERIKQEEFAGLSRNASGSTRLVHNKLEKNRRALLSKCFQGLKQQLPVIEERKSSNLDVLRMAIKYVQVLKAKSQQLEESRQKLEERKSTLQHHLMMLQLRDSTTALPSSPSTDTAEESPTVSDDETFTQHDVLKPLVETSVATTGAGILYLTTNNTLPPASSVLSQIADVASLRVELQTKPPHPLNGTNLSDAVSVLASLHTGTSRDERISVTEPADGVSAEVLAKLMASSSTDKHRLEATLTAAVPISTAVKSLCAQSSCIRQQLAAEPQAGSLSSQNRTVVQMLQQTLAQKSKCQQVTKKDHKDSKSSSSGVQMEGSSDQLEPAVITSSVQPSLSKVLTKTTLLADIAPSTLPHNPPAGSTSASLVTVNENPVLVASLGSSATVLPQQLIQLLSHSGQLTTKSLPSSGSGLPSSSVGQFILCPSLSAFSLAQVASPLAVVASGSQLTSSPLLATAVQPVPWLQMSTLLQPVPVLQTSSGSSLNPVMLAASDGAAMLVMPQQQ